MKIKKLHKKLNDSLLKGDGITYQVTDDLNGKVQNFPS